MKNSVDEMISRDIYWLMVFITFVFIGVFIACNINVILTS